MKRLARRRALRWLLATLPTAARGGHGAAWLAGLAGAGAGLAAGAARGAPAGAVPGSSTGSSTDPSPDPAASPGPSASPARDARAADPPADPGERPIAGPRALHFPRDFGAHPGSGIEWWYLTGWLQADGQHDARPDDTPPVPDVGFQITFFRSRTEVPADAPSRFAARQILFAHAAISEPGTRRLRHDQRVARAGFGIAEASSADTGVHLRDWSLVRETAGREGEAGDPRRDSLYRLHARSDSAGFAYELEARSRQPLLLQGAAGWSRKGPEAQQASLYYSQPQLAMRGWLEIEGRRRLLQGRGWLDHEWSDALLAPEADGWDWIGMNLDDGSALTAFQLRRADGSALWQGGSWRRPSAAALAFGPQDLRFRPERRWRSPATQAEYPVAWTLDSPVGRFRVEALFDAQELDSRDSTGSVYWEGLSRLLDAQGREIGRGYLEMTGYTARLRLG